ncbi:MAG: hypothetical protein HY553_04570 [Elusimicrobia bacterium]|nr:hypothetical protein [Elusimicrobiota bacterium]
MEDLVRLWSGGDAGERPAAVMRAAAGPELVRSRGSSRERERKGGALWTWRGAAATTAPAPAADARFSPWTALAELGRGHVLRGLAKLVVAVGLSRPAVAAGFGVAVALTCAAAVGFLRWRAAAPEPKGDAWPPRAESDAPASPKLTHEGLIGAIPGIYRFREKPPETTLLVTKPEGFEERAGDVETPGSRTPASESTTPAIAPPATPDLAGLLQASAGPAALGAPGSGLGDPGLRLIALQSFPNEERIWGSAVPAHAAAEALRGLRDAPGPGAGKGGGLEAFRRRAARGARLLRRPGGVAASRAMGQLKWARGMSYAGSRARADEAGSALAAAAFEQQGVSLQGAGVEHAGALPIAATAGGSSVGGGGIGPGALMSDYGEPIASEAAVPAVGPVVDATPYQPKVDRARDLSDQARKAHDSGLMQLLMGLAMIAAGIAIVITQPDPLKAVGWSLIASGTAAVAMGFMQMNQGKQKAEDARQLGDSVDRDDGQRKQADIIRCDAEAARSGKTCPPRPYDPPSPDVAGAVERERSATYRRNAPR